MVGCCGNSSPEGKCHQQNLLLSYLYLTLQEEQEEEDSNPEFLSTILKIVSMESSQVLLRIRYRYSSMLWIQNCIYFVLWIRIRNRNRIVNVDPHRIRIQVC
jgi:hypothetical protein